MATSLIKFIGFSFLTVDSAGKQNFLSVENTKENKQNFLSVESVESREENIKYPDWRA